MTWKILFTKFIVSAFLSLFCGWWATFVFEPISATARQWMYAVPAILFGLGYLYDIACKRPRLLPPLVAQIVKLEKTSWQGMLARLSPKQRSELGRMFAGGSEEAHTRLVIRRKSGAVGRWRFVLRFLLLNGGLAGLVLAAHGAGVWYFLPDKAGLEEIAQNVRLTLRKGADQEIKVVRVVNDVYTPFDKIAPQVGKALVAREDRRFYTHPGLDWRGLLRAVAYLGKRGSGSTIQQQVARSLLLSRKGGVLDFARRKFKEMILALKLNFYYRENKDKILEMYLNNVYFGEDNAPEQDFPQDLIGIETASQLYFDKPAELLDAYEAAVLIQSLTAPNAYNCVADSRRSEENARVPEQVRTLFQKMGLPYEKTTLEQTLERCVEYGARRLQTLQTPEHRYLQLWMQSQIQASAFFDQLEGDFTVVTTLNGRMQQYAQEAVAASMTVYFDENERLPQVAIVALTPDGAVRAMLGGREYSAADQQRRAVMARRQPGSTFKLFVYLAALEQGLTPESTVSDLPHTGLPNDVKSWPQNGSHGHALRPLRLLDALKESRNAAAVNLLKQVTQSGGPEVVKAMARRLGIVADFLPEPGLALALGVVEMTPLQMTTAYTVLANGGRSVRPHGLIGVYTTAGNIRHWRDSKSSQALLDKNTVTMMNRMLRAVVTDGTGKRAQFGDHIVIGKTGTAQKHSDAWFIGCTAYLCTGVWVGNDLPADLLPRRIEGGTLPAEIFRRFMQQTHAAFRWTPKPL